MIMVGGIVLLNRSEMITINEKQAVFEGTTQGNMAHTGDSDLMNFGKWRLRWFDGAVPRQKGHVVENNEKPCPKSP